MALGLSSFTSSLRSCFPFEEPEYCTILSRPGRGLGRWKGVSPTGLWGEEVEEDMVGRGLFCVSAWKDRLPLGFGMFS